LLEACVRILAPNNRRAAFTQARFTQYGVKPWGVKAIVLCLRAQNRAQRLKNRFLMVDTRFFACYNAVNFIAMRE